MVTSLEINCGTAEGNNRRKVVARLGSFNHVDRFDVDQQFARSKWRAAVISKFGLDDDAHEFLDTELIRVAAAQDESGGSLWEACLVHADEVEELQTQWFWEGHIPLGTISEFTGDPGGGKTQLSCDLSARTSRGDCMPPGMAVDGTYDRQGVLILNAEDDVERTQIPRLKAAGADLSRITLMKEMSMIGEDEKRLVMLPQDLPIIEKIIEAKKIALVICDPWVAFLDPGLSMNSDADVRRCLGQVAATAERTGVAWVNIRHLNKKSGTHAIYRGGGSIGIIGAARASFMVGHDPGDNDSRILAPVKCNLGPEPASLRFSIESHGTTSRIRWGDPCDVSAADIVGSDKTSKKGGKLDRAKEIIADILSVGPRGSNEVMEACSGEGIGASTYHKARKDLGVTSEKTEYQGQWLLTMPSTNGATF